MFSIIIPTYNASKHLSYLLESFKSQTIRDYELVVIDSSSIDNTIEIANSYNAHVITVQKSDFDHGRTRTLAAQYAHGEIIIFLSQDILLYDKDSIENITRPFYKDEKIAAVFGRQLPHQKASVFAQHLRLFNYSENSYVSELSDRTKYGIRTVFFSNSFSAFRRTVLEEINYFKEGLIFGEDMFAAAKILLNGKKIAYDASAKVFHSHNYTICQDFKRYFDMGVFHRNENWLLKEFGKAGGYAGKYIKSEFSFLRQKKRFDLFPEFIIRIFAKYLGYKLGHQYIHLPESMNKRFSLNRSWWQIREKR
ncbi:glycosyltransferase family 2 protein [Planctomycetota bacterium]